MQRSLLDSSPVCMCVENYLKHFSKPVSIHNDGSGENIEFVFPHYAEEIKLNLTLIMWMRLWSVDEKFVGINFI